MGICVCVPPPARPQGAPPSSPGLSSALPPHLLPHAPRGGLDQVLTVLWLLLQAQTGAQPTGRSVTTTERGKLWCTCTTLVRIEPTSVWGVAVWLQQHWFSLHHTWFPHCTMASPACVAPGSLLPPSHPTRTALAPTCISLSTRSHHSLNTMRSGDGMDPGHIDNAASRHTSCSTAGTQAATTTP